jgi:hypothetical protein
VSSDETERLIKMEEVLHGRVIGQEEAVSAISRAIRRARVGLKNPNRPIASFIFAGPTGVGKSELAKTLANYYFGSEEAMVGPLCWCGYGRSGLQQLEGQQQCTAGLFARRGSAWWAVLGGQCLVD